MGVIDKVSPQVKYYHKHIDAIKRKRKVYYQNNKDKFKKRMVLYRLNHLKKIQEYNKKYRILHKNELKEKHKIYSKGYRNKNRDKLICYGRERYKRIRERQLLYDRKHELQGRINGKLQKVIGLNKRDYPNFCEVCFKEQKYKLNYHHWDDNNLNKGMWVCVRCHTLCEGVDKQLAGKYLILKEQINSMEVNNGLE